MNLDELTEILYNQAIDGGFTLNQAALKVLAKLTKTEQEILMACYWIGFNDRFEGDEE